jgi:nucleotide-binding universal stress UspA family protein
MAPSVITRVTFKNILFATDFSEVSQHALMHALAMAKRFDAKLTVVHVAPPESQVPIPMEPVPLEMDWQKQRAAESMKHLEEFEPLHMYPHETVLKQGNPWPEMAGLIDSRSFDLIVLGTHGRGMFGQLLLGSVAEEVLRHAPCPVLTVGPDVLPALLDHQQLSHVLYATDFSDDSKHAFPFALSLAEENDAELTLMHVLEQLEPMPMQYSRDLLADYRKRLWDLVPDDAELWCKPQVAVDVGDAAPEIVRYAHDRQADLIVMGVHSGNVVASHLPWTVVHSVVRHARCPVLTVRCSKSQA